MYSYVCESRTCHAHRIRESKGMTVQALQGVDFSVFNGRSKNRWRPFMTGGYVARSIRRLPAGTPSAPVDSRLWRAGKSQKTLFFFSWWSTILR